AIDLPPASDRFATDKGTEVPDFRREVVPLLGRLGCNTRACHGSFQGRGGFRLSLFGYDLDADHQALLAGNPPRANRDDPEASLMLRKPTLLEDHEGGQRMSVGSWEYNLLRKWIAGGAQATLPESAELERITVTPSAYRFHQCGDTFQLRAVAHWSDGSSEDVTCLCRFRSNDDSIASVDANGLVTALRAGDTDIVTFYDKGIVPVQAYLPVSELVDAKFPPVPTPTKIDELVVAKLRSLGIVPSELCKDTEFLRRASLDITGTLPSAGEVKAFIADASQDKRLRKVDELLDRPTYAAWWTTKLCDLTGDNPQYLKQAVQYTDADSDVAAAQWYYWIYQRVQDNQPYDKLVAGLVLAASRDPGQTYEDYCRELVAQSHGNPTAFAQHQTMPWYWVRSNFRKPEEMALGFCYTFMGIQLQCAQCHKHPFDQWTQQDFAQFAKLFNRVAYGVAPDAKQDYDRLLKEADLDPKANKRENHEKLVQAFQDGKVIPQQELFVATTDATQKANSKRKVQLAGQVSTTKDAKLLGGETVDLSQYDDPRRAVFEWLQRDADRYFARVFVNRVWANYFGVGIVDPPDDLNLANPPSNPELLDYLTRAFIDHGYDMKWLHHEIVCSRTYQLSWKPNDTNRLDQRHFSHALPRRLPAEVLYDALLQATANRLDNATMAVRLEGRSIGPPAGAADVLKRGRSDNGRYALTVFGKPSRTMNCDCERSNAPSLLQTLYLRNDNDSLQLIERERSWLRELTSAQNSAPQNITLPGRQSKEIALNSLTSVTPLANVEDIVREAYLRTLSRPPSGDELSIAEHSLQDATPERDGLRDLLWALVNTKEFITNH
ncbi:MAG TPA: DUF1549 domain-containing protein, partial [Pirellulales bacterium]|nr:DUF1549 domain-containing protein [Pirellulales bacterium]